jgi:uncharacterized membrane protein YukC
LAQKFDLFSWILIGIIAVLVMMLIYVCAFMKCEDPTKQEKTNVSEKESSEPKVKSSDDLRNSRKYNTI